MKIELEIVNFIRSSAKSHCQFRYTVDELDEDNIPNNMNYYCIVTWLSTSNVLKMFVYLFEPIRTFLKEKVRFINNWEALDGKKN